MTGILLGIDAGGTRTRALLASAAGERLATAEEGPCNWTTLNPGRCLAAIDAAVAALCPNASRERVEAVCLCSAGYYAPHHREQVARALRERWPAAVIRVETDLVAAWAGALALRPGIVLAAGTGSVAYGRAGDGREARAGGWGPLFGDEGSAYWLGCRALGAIARAVDGRGPETNLARRFGAELGDAAVEPAAMLREFLRGGPAREEIAALAPRVLEEREAGDPVAAKLAQQAAEHLAGLARAVEARVATSTPLPWSWSGGLLAHTGLRELVAEALHARGSGLIAAPPRLDALHGALLLAEEALGRSAARAQLLRSGA